MDVVHKNEQLIQEIDKCLEHAKDVSDLIARGKGGRENSLVIIKLEEARHRAIDTRTQITGMEGK